MIALLSKFIKFGLVGLSGMVIDFFFTWLCKEKLRWNKFISNSIGFILAATSNYVSTEYGPLKAIINRWDVSLSSFFVS